jgi:hypothetical protein
LNHKKSIRNTIATLTAALLGTGVAGATDQNQAETSVLIYKEQNRITAGEGILGVSKMLKGDYGLNLRLTYDGMTGATPTGAAPSRKIQTFTRPSGRGSFEVPSGTIPYDQTFHDNRFAADASMTHPITRLTTLSLGTHVSAEHDYSSIGLNTGITQDLFNKNTTIGISGSYSRDNTTPVGGPPVPFTPLKVQNTPEGEGEGVRTPKVSKPKDVFDFVLGLSQIVNRKTIFRVNYSFDRSVGYLNDPYKVLSLVTPPDSADAGEPIDYFYEKRPGSENKNAVYSELRHYFNGNTVDLSYRYFWNSWGNRSHTVDVSYRFETKSGKSWQPHVRWYRQTSADFYRAFLIQGATLPQYASADSRLAKFDAITVGLQYAFPISPISHLSLSAEYYTQMGDKSPPGTFGTMTAYDLFPKMKALMLRVGYSYDF